jgi:hypothetical protein
MGCDIHFYVERRVNGVWQTADTWEPEGDSLHVDYKKAFYHSRNYDLFSILADVRNGHGFAGVKTGEDFIPMFAPRGVPDDACPEYKAEIQSWGGDAHSASWVSLSEILSYDWTEKTIKQGWVDVTEWARARDNNGEGPEGWSESIGGGAVKHLTTTDFEKAWQTLRTERGYKYDGTYPLTQAWRDENKADTARMIELLGGGHPVCLVAWTVPYYKPGSTFLSEVLPRLLRLGAPDDVRCTFFDN